eukprot:TRINITY_DN6919_c0_g1_i1.p1 TRINITY_DN6919_c0_g1~~TRINITY_DN6919_c0_g1_i1.p1  ORF type:complete len:211 (+),score=54.25 TRINITY_DN6919_c0_g1_i1:390-1022(+)
MVLQAKIGFYPVQWTFQGEVLEDSSHIIRDEFVLFLSGACREMERRYHVLTRLLVDKQALIEGHQIGYIQDGGVFDQRQFEKIMNESNEVQEIMKDPISQIGNYTTLYKLYKQLNFPEDETLDEETVLSSQLSFSSDTIGLKESQTIQYPSSFSLEYVPENVVETTSTETLSQTDEEKQKELENRKAIKRKMDLKREKSETGSRKKRKFV